MDTRPTPDGGFCPKLPLRHQVERPVLGIPIYQEITTVERENRLDAFPLGKIANACVRELGAKIAIGFQKCAQPRSRAWLHVQWNNQPLLDLIEKFRDPKRQTSQKPCGFRQHGPGSQQRVPQAARLVNAALVLEVVGPQDGDELGQRRRVCDQEARVPKPSMYFGFVLRSGGPPGTQPIRPSRTAAS